MRTARPTWYAELFRNVWCMNQSDFWPSESGNVSDEVGILEFCNYTCKVPVRTIKYDLV